MNHKYEVVRFEKDGLMLDVNVSSTEDTVWLDVSIVWKRQISYFKAY